MAVTTSGISSLKVLLISTSVLSIAMVMKLSVPLILDFIIYPLPSIWSFTASWLRPPYVYVVINGIIISIAASSCFHHKDRHHDGGQNDSDPSENLLKSSPLVELPTIFSTDSGPNFDVVQPVTELISNNTRIESLETEFVNNIAIQSLETEFITSRSNWTPEIQNSETMLITAAERPMALSRFNHRKHIKANPEGKRGGLKVAKPRRQETLENTWKTITEGRHMPLNRHFKKSEAQEANKLQSATNLDANESLAPTISDRANNNCNSRWSTATRTGRIRKEPSLNDDELNRRVEAFIRKMNEDMRLERQESLRQYQEMIGRLTMN